MKNLALTGILFVTLGLFSGAPCRGNAVTTPQPKPSPGAVSNISKAAVLGSEVITTKADLTLPTTVDEIAGEWALKGIKGDPVTIAIKQSGAFHGTRDGCRFKGNLSRMVIGQNFYEMKVSFSDSCRNPGEKTAGLAWTQTVPGNKQMLVFVLRETSISSGHVIFGVRDTVTILK